MDRGRWERLYSKQTNYPYGDFGTPDVRMVSSGYASATPYAEGNSKDIDFKNIIDGLNEKLKNSRRLNTLLANKKALLTLQENNKAITPDEKAEMDAEVLEYTRKIIDRINDIINDTPNIKWLETKEVDKLKRRYNSIYNIHSVNSNSGGYKQFKRVVKKIVKRPAKTVAKRPAKKPVKPTKRPVRK